VKLFVIENKFLDHKCLFLQVCSGMLAGKEVEVTPFKLYLGVSIVCH